MGDPKREAAGRDLLDLWNDLSQQMGEMAAYHVACKQLGISPFDGWDLIDEATDPGLAEVPRG